MKNLLIIGCGDVMRRALPWLCRRFSVIATVRDDGDNARALRALGAKPIFADLDRRDSLRRLQGIARWVIHSAPPAEGGLADRRTRALIAALRRPRRSRAKNRAASLTQPPQRFAYISTSGVYGDCAGEKVSESRPLQPTTARARRRADAEKRVRALGRSKRRASFKRSRAAARLLPVRSARVSILRAPGIYAADRLPLPRLQRGDPVLRARDDVFTNHIHALDLARATATALFRGKGGRAFNASDDNTLKMGDYFDAVADAFNLPRPERVSRAEAALRLPPMMLSFMSESRRLDNARLKRELRLALRYPLLGDVLREARTRTL